VKQRLLDVSRRRGEAFDVVLTRFAIERLLYRLTQTPHASRFILKGAMLFSIWMDRPYRPTRDVDLLGSGDSSAPSLEGVFREVCVIAVEPDGLRFDPDSVEVSEIREDQVYQGLRVTLRAYLGKARIAVQADVGFGDAVTPAPTAISFGPLLDFPAPMLRAYPPESVIAEKVEAMVALGIANSRMKDFFDLWTMSRTMAFDGPQLAAAIAATFQRRQTPIPLEPPVAMTGTFASNPAKITQWTSFIQRIEEANRSMTLQDVVTSIAEFLGPILRAIADGSPFHSRWTGGGPWRSIDES
jgi:hypothetical protein